MKEPRDPRIDALITAFNTIAKDYGDLTDDALKMTKLVHEVDQPWSDDEKSAILRELILDLVDRVPMKPGDRFALKAVLKIPPGKSLGQDYADKVTQWNNSVGLDARLVEFRAAWDEFSPESALDGDRAAIINSTRQWWYRGRNRLVKALRLEIDSRNDHQGRGWQKKTPASTSNTPLSSGVVEKSTGPVEAAPLSYDISLTEAARLALADFPHPPFSLIWPNPDRTWGWQDVLDGSPLTPTHCAGGAIIDRRVMVGGQPKSVSEFAEWLTTDRTGKTVFLYGQAGDGKSSYLNNLAVKSLGTHVFLRWSTDIPFKSNVVEDYRVKLIASLKSRGLEVTPTVVVVYTLAPYVDLLVQQSLINNLDVRKLDGDGVVVLIDGRPGQFRGAAFQVDRVDLAPLGPDEARKWIELLRVARSKCGLSESTIIEQHPNLPAFLELDEDTQVTMLTDVKSPLLVRLLRAVYGKDMWGKLARELADLKNPADQKAYFHVCLASVAGATLPEFMLESLASGANLRDRAKHDPWVRTEDDEHIARHAIIAQVVLETSEDRRYFLDRSVRDYTNLVRSSNSIYLDTLQKIAIAAKHLEPVGSSKTFHDLHNDLLKAVRSNLLAVENLAQLIGSKSRSDYQFIVAWARVIESLIPKNKHARSDRSWLLRDVAITLWKKAEHAPNCPDAEPPIYYHTKLLIRKMQIQGEVSLASMLEELEKISGFMGRRWCTQEFYFDLFNWSRQTLSGLREEEKLEGEEVNQARALYWIYFMAYQYLRLFCSPGKLEGFSRSYKKMISRSVHVHLPDHAPELIKQAWLKSISLNNPCVKTAILYAECFLGTIETKRINSSISRTVLGEVAEILRAASDFEPNNGEIIFYLALINEHEIGDTDNEWLAIHIEAVSNDAFELNRAYGSHAHAILEPDQTVKIKLLKRAIKGYAGHAKMIYGFQRVEFAWRQAWRHLQKAGSKDWLAARRRFERVRSESPVEDD